MNLCSSIKSLTMGYQDALLLFCTQNSISTAMSSKFGMDFDVFTSGKKSNFVDTYNSGMSE